MGKNFKILMLCFNNKKKYFNKYIIRNILHSYNKYYFVKYSLNKNLPVRFNNELINKYNINNIVINCDVNSKIFKLLINKFKHNLDLIKIFRITFLNTKVENASMYFLFNEIINCGFKKEIIREIDTYDYPKFIKRLIIMYKLTNFIYDNPLLFYGSIIGGYLIIRCFLPSK